MRLDPKYFNLFLVVCAAITILVIIFSTLRYASNQKETFREEIGNAELSSWNLYHYESGDSLTVADFKGSPVIIHFWSTWSDLSMELNKEMHQLKMNSPELIVIAAAARDARELVEEHISRVNNDFVYLDGTPLYQDLMVPGLPSQLFVDREGKIVDQNVGKNTEAIRRKANQLLNR